MDDITRKRFKTSKDVVDTTDAEYKLLAAAEKAYLKARGTKYETEAEKEVEKARKRFKLRTGL